MMFFCADHIPRGVSFYPECDALLPCQIFPPTSFESIRFVLREVKQFFEDMTTRTRNQEEQLKNDVMTLGKQMARIVSLKRELVMGETKNSLVLNRGRFACFWKDVGKLHTELMRSMERTAQENARIVKPARKRRKEEADGDYVGKRIK